MANDARRIESIDRGTVSQLCSGQVITQLSTAVKELVENALDADASLVDVRLFNYGADKVEVEDNGTGIPREYLAAVVAKHSTSKIRDFDEIGVASSFGFRGEALSSLCELSRAFTVSTRTPQDEMGVQADFAKDGTIISESPCARQTGTTVTVQGLFEPLPVRRREFLRTVRRQYTKALLHLQAYALQATGVRFSCTHVGSSGKRQVVLSTRGNRHVRENISNVFGPRFLRQLQPFDVDLPLADAAAPSAAEQERKDDAPELGRSATVSSTASSVPYSGSTGDSVTEEFVRRVEGFVSCPGEGVGRSNNDRQFTFVNGRPVELPRVVRTVNDAWRQYEMKQKPAFILNFCLPPGTLDVNITPDKREVLVTKETAMLTSLKAALDTLWAPSRNTFRVGQGGLGFGAASQNPSRANPVPGCEGEGEDKAEEEEEENRSDHSHLGRSGTVDSAVSGVSDVAAVESSHSSLSSSTRRKRLPLRLPPSEPARGAGSEGPTHSGRNNDDDDGIDERHVERKESVEEGSTGHGVAVGGNSDKHNKCQMVEEEDELVDDAGADREELQWMEGGGMTFIVEDGTDRQDEQELTNGASEVELLDSGTDENGPEEGVTRAMVSGDSRGEEDNEPSPSASVPQSLQHSAASAPAAKRRKTQPGPSRQREKCDWTKIVAGYRGARETNESSGLRRSSSLPRVSAAAGVEAAESGVAEAELTRVLSKRSFKRMRVIGQFNHGFIIAQLGSDLFIVDQHASDEKNRYEHLLATTSFYEQPLLQPRQLDVTAAQEHVIMDYPDVFRRNGFRFTVDEDAAPGHKVKLTAIPFSKNIKFGVDDIHELTSILAESPQVSNTVRPSKAMAMFASRACRSAIMIGRPLTRSRMQTVLRGLADLDQPWNCPHGRPTLRHLVDLRQVLRHAEGDDEAAAGQAAQSAMEEE